MKALGLIGGTSWYSTIDYYRYLNQIVNEKLGKNNNPPIVLFNLNQKEIHDLQAANNWDGVADLLVDAGNKLKAAGVKGIIFCANTPHKLYDQVSAKLKIPILHITDATAKAIQKKGLKKVGLIGTIFTMEGDFIIGKLKNEYQIEAIVPEKNARERLHQIIMNDLSCGNFGPDIKKYVLEELQKLKSRGAEGIILGCTEFPILIKEKDFDLPLFDTTFLHAQMAADFILS